MGALREYILSITAAAVISSVLSALLDQKGMPGTMGKLFCGVFLSIALIRPLADLSFDSVTDWIDSVSVEGVNIAAQGEKETTEQIRSGIKARCEAYIQDKAGDMGIEIAAEVILSDIAPYPPEAVKLEGTAAPYNRALLLDVIEKDLAVSREKIQWK